MYLTYDNINNRDTNLLDFVPGGLTPYKLRDELSYILNTTGYWIVLRSFDLNRRSKYWNPSSQEAIGGPPWEFKCYIFKSRHVPLAKATTTVEELNKYGLIDKDGLLFYFSHKIDVKDEDEILWIDGDITSDLPPDKIKVKRVYSIEMVVPKIDDIHIFTVVKAKVKTNINDETLLNEIPVEYIPV